ncbi:MAG: prepilin-type N-terminal cleavage/methylation domain-containing protein [Phycisphaerae bacterium]
MFNASDQYVPPSGRRPRRRGFTLVELLLVMFVLSVLVALVVGVGSYVIEQARITETVANQQALIAAIDAYRKVTGYFPDANGLEGDIESLMDTLQPDGNAPREVEIRKEVTPFLKAGSGSLMVDAFGTTMKYYARRGLGGKPLVVSAGPDGDFGDIPVNETKQRDNIRSDTHGKDGRRSY